MRTFLASVVVGSKKIYTESYIKIHEINITNSCTIGTRQRNNISDDLLHYSNYIFVRPYILIKYNLEYVIKK